MLSLISLLVRDEVESSNCASLFINLEKGNVIQII